MPLTLVLHSALVVRLLTRDILRAYCNILIKTITSARLSMISMYYIVMYTAVRAVWLFVRFEFARVSPMRRPHRVTSHETMILSY